MNAPARRIRQTEIATKVDPDLFRGAMRALASGVSIFTVGRGSDVSGMTVTSVSSLAVEPASLIVSINRQASSWPLLNKYGAFGISILPSDQVDVAKRFSGLSGFKGVERFSAFEWTSLASGVPLLAGALAVFDCRVEHVVEYYSHAIVIGRVLDLRAFQGRPALAYWEGQYGAYGHDRSAETPSVVDQPTARALWQV